MAHNDDWMNWHHAPAMAPSLDTYDQNTVRHWLGEQEIRKALPYRQAVQHLQRLTDTELSAQVQGSARIPYRVDIHLSQGPLISLCTCPVGRHCKHVAAVLLAYLQERGTLQPVDGPRPHVMQWLGALRSHLHPPPRKIPSTTYRLHWILEIRGHLQQGPILYCLKARFNKQGVCNELTPWSNFEPALRRPPSFLDETDQAAIRRLLIEDIYASRSGHFMLGPRHGSAALSMLAASERLFMNKPGSSPLRMGDLRSAKLIWKTGKATGSKDSEQFPVLITEPPALVLLALDTPWYLDSDNLEIGPVDTPIKMAVLQDLLQAPPLNIQEAALLRNLLEESAPDLPAPVVDPIKDLPVIHAPLQPQLYCDTLSLMGMQSYRQYPSLWSSSCRFDYGQPSFIYGPAQIAVDDDSEIQTLDNGETVRVQRDREGEKNALKILAKTGMKAAKASLFHSLSLLPQNIYGLASEDDWTEFMQEGVQMLREYGWEVRWPEGFRHHFLQIDAWDMQVDGEEAGWLGLDVGIVVEGERLALAPLLGALFARDGRWLSPGGLSSIPDTESIHLHTPSGVPIQTQAHRLKPLVGTLIDLFSLGTAGPLRVSAYDVTRLTHMDMDQWRSEGMEAIRRLSQRLPQSGEIPPVEAPQGIALPLRPYQQEGLAWLQFLREHDLGGILADDMGLGKTAQTLAHILLEKESGRLQNPALIIMPTSLIHNWREEAERFAPALRVLSLHGKERLGLFREMGHHDLILTTYPLVWRDIDLLKAQQFHLLILDEAQMVKNAQSRAAEAIREIPTHHRLALTGTPLENHLGELWAQFDFLLPGFMGDLPSFQKIWRNPIERHGDVDRLSLLAKRVRPFILRRKKEEVAQELPEKTIIIRSVDIEGTQRDLYETVRSAMDERIRQEIAAKGFQRSQIVILDAMLKLRQVCCDPRLLKSEKARKVQESAKLTLLMEMIPELLAEGRQILLFSQFTEMLALISARLDKIHIPYVQLTGSTQDRKTPIDRFQRGEVSLFLISLKAGGVGLNLTAADTVIHYDPWWNPAAENQATDRAHRIGQQRRVFVYKLIVAGSIEEKILALQERKAILASGVLDKARKEKLQFGPEDLASLLAPLPENSR